MPRKPSYDRDDLINRARDLFWKRGWAGTSLKDLEAELKMKPGSFYAAFGSKDALFALALDRYAADGQDRLKALAEAKGPLGALQAFPMQVLQNTQAAAKACMLSKTLLELQAHAHPLADQADAHLRRMEASFADLFRAAQAQGLITSNQSPAALARRYQSDLLGLRVSAQRPGIDAKAIAQEMSQELARL
ncbi:TetR/AcrR family transcriptional regulator [Marinovum sp. 2_MG-2023]|uniref:TetR/AcrR family transcriptional regulator n=1 Tax=unclassified Marinovum TaxID=2647166 RepID=UPI0026E289C2|nr:MULTISPECIES: TetR/AcrR family transcriptional regulator [unclassified Marinovum]MDO6729564.1 TetR/AcrR family transcriptional regulator [Marinovum sp. 2_MG-2023]MDO6780282.1 TetR/AcrR family transcriptional regulator [Marinovum sp. 1_MG-2023]